MQEVPGEVQMCVIVDKRLMKDPVRCFLYELSRDKMSSTILTNSVYVQYTSLPATA